jgi:DNA-binding SARP family transcriptional activator
MSLPDLQFRLLGIVEVRRNGCWHGVTPTRSRQVLSLLLCAPGQVVLVDRIIAALWGEDLPQTPCGLVRNYIMRLRRVLDSNAPIVTRSGGYQLAVDPSTVDAVRFESCLRRARHAQDPAEAERALDEAFSYWRGPALADARQSPVLEQEAGRLEDLYVAGKQLVAELMIARESFAEVASELQPLVAVHPNRLRLWELMMVALAHDGRSAEALDAYARCRTYHRTEYGLDPGERMSDLQQAVLRGQIDHWQISGRQTTGQRA